MSSHTLRFVRKGEIVTLHDVPPTRTLLEVLREDLHCTGTKEGCAEGDCGACTVVIGSLENGRLEMKAVNSCIQFTPTLDGKALFTVEDLQQAGGALHPVQQALVECHGSQCGFCTPGFVMTLVSLVERADKISEEEMKRYSPNAQQRIRELAAQKNDLRDERDTFKGKADSFDQLLVTGPLGQGLASLDRRGTRWLLTTMEGRQFRADDPESLTESALGWRLPLGGLVDWVQGRPGTGSGREAQVERDGEGRITRILQDGWRVEYLAWQADHPSRINLQRAADALHEALELRIVVDEFSRASP